VLEIQQNDASATPAGPTAIDPIHDQQASGFAEVLKDFSSLGTVGVACVGKCVTS